jgi:hypothetical protein
MTRRQYSGGAITASLIAGINGVDTVMSCTALTGWPDGSIGPFFIVIGRGTASEEKILCLSRAGNSITVATGGRGADGTSATSHSTGAVVEHIFTATDADEANYHVNTSTSTSTVGIHGLANGSSVVGTTDTQTLQNKTIASPILTGNPTAPTPSTSDNDTSVATTAYVKAQNVTGFHGIQTGTVTVTVPANNPSFITQVNFGTAFSSAPKVFFTNNPAVSGLKSVGIAQVTTSMFIAMAFVSSTSAQTQTFVFDWMAIGPGA